jgi:inner membrane protein involved in colicin E2 resistance
MNMSPGSESNSWLAAMPQSLPMCRDPAFSQASIKQIHLRDGVTEYQRGHRAGIRYTIQRMHDGNMAPD